ncbi:TetR/AcrR family transcriptional regulator [Glaciihabitans sp. dw_435]|uniref:TetR/AcrR family transcriptional regulator n=1 Tax=Glaciihabitans sp. dw_435 TaxID=2720081 RepID=UPI001BD2069E|nr:TetR/AcrR family transcriptional regulator [Glaciihabitans sp. dw_435]
MPTLRRDAARNRDRIMAAAKELSDAGQALQLNVVARRAEVGIGTVYRHFASPEALSEGLVDHRFIQLLAEAKFAAENPDALGALRHFLTESLGVFVEDPAFAAASVNASPVRDETRLLRNQLVEAFAILVRRSESHLRPGLDALDLMILTCGLGYSVRLRPEKSSAYLAAMLDEVLV